jgi:predicted transcriptional regulator
LAWLVKALWGLFARSSRPPALKNPRRNEVFQLIQAESGLSLRALERRLGWPIGTLRFNLGRLVEDGLVARQPYRNSTRKLGAGFLRG